MSHEILQPYIDDIRATTDLDKEHAFSQVISFSRTLLHLIGEDGIRTLLSVAAEHFGFPNGIVFREEIAVSKKVKDIQPILDEFCISIKTLS